MSGLPSFPRRSGSGRRTSSGSSLTDALGLTSNSNNNVMYNPLGVSEDDDDDHEPEVQRMTREESSRFIEPLEVDRPHPLTTPYKDEDDDFLDDDEQHLEDDEARMIDEMWILPSMVLSFVAVLILLAFMWTVYDLTWQGWTTLPFSLHLVLNLSARRLQLHSSIPMNTLTRIVTSVSCVVDLVLLGKLYPFVASMLVRKFFTDVDKTPILEYSRQYALLNSVGQLCLFAAGIRLVLAGTRLCCAQSTVSCLGRTTTSFLAKTLQKRRRILRLALNVGLGASLTLVVVGFVSSSTHLSDKSEPPRNNNNNDPACDPLDRTECMLPYPSFHYMRRDASSETGWRVNLQHKILPPIKGRGRAGGTMQMDFLNKLDGFSTMGPLLFYIDGMKEAHEAGIVSAQRPRLIGHDEIGTSLTAESVTLLLDVNASLLVAHTAEIDYLDPRGNLVMVFPAQPLKHNNHYALAVVGATDSQGNMLPKTPGMAALLQDSKNERSQRFTSVVVPRFTEVAPWFSISKTQLMFDFVTASEESQLGPVRRVRDATLDHFQSEWRTDNWQVHVRVVRQTDTKCQSWSPTYKKNDLIARTLHIEMDVPWFLEGYGPGQRGAYLNDKAVDTGQPTKTGIAKVMILIPCSARAAALGANDPSAKPIRAVMEVGHGLFGTRARVGDDYLQQMANDEGYILTAMDWRGMSSFDLLVFLRALMSDQSQFQAIRDNLIQGFAAKFILQSFTKNFMLEADWLLFEDQFGKPHRTPTLNNKQPISVYYGNSQGSILGVGYTSLMGPSKLIERSILGVPGLNFNLVLTRSLDAVHFAKFMLFSMYNYRHVRMVMALFQEAWNAVEGAGILAEPIREPYPPVLMQAGLGDVFVPAIAAECLARAYGASILKSNPHDVYGVPKIDAPQSSDTTPHVVMTEMLYEKEYYGLPKDNLTPDSNPIHGCVRRELNLQQQVKEFVNTGRVIDVCKNNACIQDHVSCGKIKDLH